MGVSNAGQKKLVVVHSTVVSAVVTVNGRGCEPPNPNPGPPSLHRSLPDSRLCHWSGRTFTLFNPLCRVPALVPGTRGTMTLRGKRHTNTHTHTREELKRSHAHSCSYSRTHTLTRTHVSSTHTTTVTHAHAWTHAHILYKLRAFDTLKLLQKRWCTSTLFWSYLLQKRWSKLQIFFASSISLLTAETRSISSSWVRLGWRFVGPFAAKSFFRKLKRRTRLSNVSCAMLGCFATCSCTC